MKPSTARFTSLKNRAFVTRASTSTRRRNSPTNRSCNSADPNALEARNIIFNGALVVDGECLAVVIRSGDATLIGSMVELTGDSGGTQSTLKADIQYFVTFLTGFALVQAAVVFIVGCVASGHVLIARRLRQSVTTRCRTAARQSPTSRYIAATASATLSAEAAVCGSSLGTRPIMGCSMAPCSLSWSAAQPANAASVCAQSAEPSV
jgi:hypothetical protein